MQNNTNKCKNTETLLTRKMKFLLRIVQIKATENIKDKKKVHVTFNSDLNRLQLNTLLEFKLLKE